MKIPPRTPTPVDDYTSHYDMLPSHDKFQASQKLRLKSYIEATQPELAEAYERELVAFQRLSDALLKPILAIVADSALCDGRKIRLIQDKNEDGIFGLATPGIRLLILNETLTSLDLSSLTENVTYLGFYGCCPNHAVMVVTEVHGIQPAIQCERLVDYSALSIEGVKEILGEFLRQAGVNVTNIGTTLLRSGQ